MDTYPGTANIGGPSSGSRADGGDGAESENGLEGVDDLRDYVEPQTRRPKRARTGAPGNGVSRRKRGRLSALPTMPLDILFEIFAHLPPADLIQLTRVTKAFRQVLMSRQSAFLWKQAYELVPDVPPCPEDMSEPAWAHLLFGGAFCHTCGAKPVNKILFFARRRACKACTVNCTVDIGEYLRYFPRLEMWHLDLAPSIIDEVKRLAWWMSDLEAVQRELDEILETHGGICSEAYENAIKEFKAEKERTLKKKLLHLDICEAWENARLENRSNELLNLKEQRFENVKARLLELGHDEQDIDELRDHREVNVAKLMSDRIWTRVCPILEPELLELRESRLAAEARDRYDHRATLVKALYISHVEMLPIRMALCMPLASAIADRTIFTEAIQEDEPLSIGLGERLWNLLEHLLPNLVGDVAERAEALVSLIPSEVRALDPTSTLSDNSLLTDDFYTGAAAGLGLATTQFTCCSDHQYCRLYSEEDRTFSGLEMLGHRCMFECASPVVEYSHEAAQIALDLLQLVGRPPNTTALQMDRLDARFLCSSCHRSVDADTNPYGTQRCWRAAIAHTIYHRRRNGIARWSLLDTLPKGGQRVVDEFTRPWGCDHCHFHLGLWPDRSEESWLNMEEVLSHLREAHGIDDPENGLDYFPNVRQRKTPQSEEFTRLF